MNGVHTVSKTCANHTVPHSKGQLCRRCNHLAVRSKHPCSSPTLPKASQRLPGPTPYQQGWKCPGPNSPWPQATQSRPMEPMVLVVRAAGGGGVRRRNFF